MKRRVGLILLLLVAGVIVNVAVAWGGQAVQSQFVSAYTWNWMDASKAQDLWDRFANSDWPAQPGPSTELHTFGCTFLQVDSREAPLFGCYWESAGWPRRSVEGGAIYRNNQFESRWRWQRSITVGGRERQFQLSLHPMWPGFAINTLFYAGILWMLFAAPFALRRRRRIKRGLCPACAYPTWGGGESEVCTECGTPHTVKPKEMAA